MAERAREATQVHTRLLKCMLEVENSRAYWQLAASAGPQDATERAFKESWFGARSLERVTVLLSNFRVRFDAYPHALSVLNGWAHMDPVTRAVICHWHVQLADPMYRDFTGVFLAQRHASGRAEVTRDVVIRWVEDQDAGKWTPKTRVKFASNLLATAKSAGLVKTARDPRPLVYPRVGEAALTYLLYLLRGVEFAGTLVENPYLASVGIDRRTAEDRLRTNPALTFRAQGDLMDFGWKHADLESWAAATVGQQGAA